MGNNAELKNSMDNAFINLQAKCNRANAYDKIALRKELNKLSIEKAKFNTAMLNKATIVTDADMAEMAKIKKEIDAAADKQQLIKAIIKTVAFVAKKVI